MSAARRHTANAVMVLSVLGLICAGMNARMKFGTLRRQSPAAAPRQVRTNEAHHRQPGRREACWEEGYGRGYVERSKDCQKRARQSIVVPSVHIQFAHDPGRPSASEKKWGVHVRLKRPTIPTTSGGRARTQEAKRPRRCEKESTKDARDALEFHPGPKGKSHANTVRMTGDWADSSSSLRAPSCCMGPHAWMSASWGTVEGEQWVNSVSHVRPFSPGSGRDTHRDDQGSFLGLRQSGASHREAGGEREEEERPAVRARAGHRRDGGGRRGRLETRLGTARSPPRGSRCQLHLPRASLFAL